MARDSALPVTDAEMERLLDRCRQLPAAAGGYVDDNFGPYDDYVTNVLLTVLDLQMHNVAVDKAIRQYWNNRWDGTRDLVQLEAVLDRFPDTPDGNKQAAQYLWGNNHWTRIQWLRGFVSFLDHEDLTSQERLKVWAATCDYQRDFEGRVKNLGFAACQWLRMRLGVDTVKPDTHTKAFVENAIDRSLNDWGVVRVIEEAATTIGIRARQLDGAIWEYQRRGPGTISRRFRYYH